MIKSLDGLMFITQEAEAYGHLESAKIALQGNCKLIQLRMKEEVPLEQREMLAREVKKLTDLYDAQLFINDDAELASKIGALAVHLGKTDTSPLEARMQLGADYCIGATANTLEDIERLVPMGVDYIGLGPLRYTPTKKILSPILGYEGYRHILGELKRKQIHTPIFAIGGIVFSDLAKLFELGLAGVAVSSSLLKAENPVQEVSAWVEVITKIKSHHHGAPSDQ